MGSELDHGPGAAVSLWTSHIKLKQPGWFARLLASDLEMRLHHQGQSLKLFVKGLNITVRAFKSRGCVQG